MIYKNNDSNPFFRLEISLFNIQYYQIIGLLKIIHSNTLYYEYIFILIYLNLFRIKWFKMIKT